MRIIPTKIKDLQLVVMDNFSTQNLSRANLLNIFNDCFSGITTNVNISNSGQWTAIAGHKNAHVGVDLEAEVNIENYMDAAEDFFHKSECGILLGLKDFEKQKYFFTALWAIKEAWRKATHQSIAALPGPDLSNWLEHNLSNFEQGATYYIIGNLEITHEVIMLDDQKHHLATAIINHNSIIYRD